MEQQRGVIGTHPHSYGMSFSRWIVDFFSSNDGGGKENTCKSTENRKFTRSCKKVGSLIKLSATSKTVEPKSVRNKVTLNLIPTVIEADDWDRSPCYLQDPYYIDTRPRRTEAKGPLLTPVAAYLIQQELNKFKTQEMLIHQDSLHMTRLYNNRCK